MFISKLHKYVGIVMILSILPQTSFALTGVKVAGSCNSSGMIASTDDLTEVQDSFSEDISDMQDSINDTLEEGFKALRSGQKTMTSSLESLIVEMMDTQDHLLREQIQAEGNLRREENFGALAQPTGACANTSMAANSYLGLQQTKLLTSKIATAIQGIQGKHPNRNAAHAEMYEGMTMETATPEKMFPESGTFEEEDLAGALSLTSLIVDPNPTLKLPDGATPVKAAEYNRNRFLKNAYLATPQQVLSERLAYRSPVISTEDWKENALTALGEELPEKISPQQLLDLQVDSRLNSATWMNRITQLYEPGLLREGLVMQSIELDIARRQLSMIEHIATMLAQKTAREINDEYTPKLDGAASRAMTKE